MEIGTRGFWVDDNEHCEVVSVVDEAAGVYEFRSLEKVAFTDHGTWLGFIEDFYEEC